MDPLEVDMTDGEIVTSADLLDLSFEVEDGATDEAGMLSKPSRPFAVPYDFPDNVDGLASDGTISRDSGLECLSPATGDGWISQDSGVSRDVSKDNILETSSDYKICRDSGIADSITQSLSSEMSFEVRNDLSNNFESANELEFHPNDINTMSQRLAKDMENNPYLKSEGVAEEKGYFSDSNGVDDLQFQPGAVNDMVLRIADDMRKAELEFLPGDANTMVHRIRDDMRNNPHHKFNHMIKDNAWISSSQEMNGPVVHTDGQDAVSKDTRSSQVQGSMMYGSDDDDEDDDEVDEESEDITKPSAVAPPAINAQLNSDMYGSDIEEVEVGSGPPVDHDRYGSDVEEVELGPAAINTNAEIINKSHNKDPELGIVTSGLMYPSDDEDDDDEDVVDEASEELDVLNDSSSDEEETGFDPHISAGRHVGPGIPQPTYSDSDPIPRAANPTPISAMNMVIDADTPPSTATSAVEFDLMLGATHEEVADPGQDLSTILEQELEMPGQKRIVECLVEPNENENISRGLESIEFSMGSLEANTEDKKSSPTPGGLNLGSMLSYDTSGTMDDFTLTDSSSSKGLNEPEKVMTIANVETGESSDENIVLSIDKDDPCLDISPPEEKSMDFDDVLFNTGNNMKADVKHHAQEFEDLNFEQPSVRAAEATRMTSSADAADLELELCEPTEIRQESLERIAALDFFDEAIRDVEDDIRHSIYAQGTDSGSQDTLTSPSANGAPPRKVIPDPMPDDVEDQVAVNITSLKAEEKQEEDDFEFEVPKVILRRSLDDSMPDSAPGTVEEKEKSKQTTDSSSEESDSEDEVTAALANVPRVEPADLDVSQTIIEEPWDGEDAKRRVVPSEPVVFDDQDDTALTKAEAEWDGVQTITPGVQTNNIRGPPVSVSSKPLISYCEVEDHMKAMDLSEYKPQIRTTVQRRGFAAFSHALFGPPKLHRDLLGEKENIFCMAACQLNNESIIHMQTLQTVYRRLTGSKFECQRFGAHWEIIGFQGNDPATDLRGSGFLGLMQLLYMVTEPSLFGLAKDIYCLSLHETQNFPFCLMGINITGIVIQLLREDVMNKECNRRKSVLTVMNEYYAGLYYHLYNIWKYQHKSIKDSGFVIKDVETFARKSSKNVLKNLETHLVERRNQKKGPGGPEWKQDPLTASMMDECAD